MAASARDFSPNLQKYTCFSQTMLLKMEKIFSCFFQDDACHLRVGPNHLLPLLLSTKVLQGDELRRVGIGIAIKEVQFPKNAL